MTSDESAGYGKFPQVFSLPATGTGGAVNGGQMLLTGWALHETTGAAAAVVNIINGADAGGQLVARVNLSVGQSVRDDTGAIGILLDAGCFVQVASGSVAGTIWGVRV